MIFLGQFITEDASEVIEKVHSLVDANKADLISEYESKMIIDLARKKDRNFFVRICQTYD